MLIRFIDLYQNQLYSAEAPANLVFIKEDYLIFRSPEEKEEAGQALGCFITPIASIYSSTGKKTVEILRKATAFDLQKIKNHLQKNKQALEIICSLIEQHKLGMRCLWAGHSFDGKNLHFMFTAPERVDFRELVLDLSKNIHKKIYLQQIGPRDRARILGGYGRCGKKQCCSTFLQELPSVTMDTARLQNLLFKSTTKLSGSCGKLLCCLNYELEDYTSLRNNLPEVGTRIKVKSKEGQVVGVDILNQLVRVQFKEFTPVETFTLNEVHFSDADRMQTQFTEEVNPKFEK